MKILHKSKRTTPPHPQVADVIKKILDTPNENITEVLGPVDVWRWPRSDLNAWINVLNKFDVMLEDFIRDYDVDKLQVTVFTPSAKNTICEILRFERLLLENSTNRKMFNSYDRLNSFLFTSDLDILILALNLLLRPSQQYSAQPSVSHALNISTSRLQSLSKRWPNLRDYGVGLVDLVSPQGSSLVDALPGEAREVSYSFYRTEANSRPKDKDTQMETDVFETPRKASTAGPATTSKASGAVIIHIDEQYLESKESMHVLADTIQAFSVPDEEKFELLCRIRSAIALNSRHSTDRDKLAIVRLLAIAIFGHTHSESQAQSSLFLYEPDLITHIAELLQLDRGVPVPVQTAAIAALDALARYRNRMQEVLTAVNAGVNHGILMALLRKTVGDVANPESTLPHSFVESLLSFVTFIASHASGGTMLVGAGLVPLLIQIIETKLPQRLLVVSKAMQLVDNVIYGFSNAFQLFCNGHGVDALVDRIMHEVDFDIQEYGDEQRSRELFGSYGQLPVARAAILKHILRSMHRMMQSSGTAEGLRGLIDSSILKSIKKIIEYRGLFGPSILPLAINIMATFVHNEPTSLAVIQEAGLPEVFYEAIESGLEPVIEVIQAIPNAIGALCLNQAGQEQLSARPSIIPGIFTIFTSERHLKVLQDKENAVLIGTSIDELIRHHPSLKTPVFEAIKATLGKIEDLGNAFVAPENLKVWYRLGFTGGSTSGEDVTMSNVDSPLPNPSVVPDLQPDFNHSHLSGFPDDTAPRSHDNLIVSYIDIVGRFFEGLFQHTPHCRDFIANTDGLARIGKITALPCLPYDFANSVVSDSWVQVMRTMTEVATSETLLFLARLVQESLTATKEFWVTRHDQSKLLSLVDITSPQDEIEANRRFRQLVTLHIRITLLSDVFATAGYAHGRMAIGLLQTLMVGDSLQVVMDLGALHRACIWENILLKAGLTAEGVEIVPTPQPSPMEQSPARTLVPLPETDVDTQLNGSEGPSARSTKRTPTASLGRDDNARQENAKALKHLTRGLPSSLASFFQAIVKLFYARRNPDPAQKKQILKSSSIIADILLIHVSRKEYDKLSTYAYYSVMIGLITTLLVDERTSQSTLQTVLVAAFYHAGGFGAIFEVCRDLMSSIEVISKINPGERTEAEKQELSSAFGGIQMALHLLQPLLSSKLILESGQTALITTKDKKDTDPDYFEPHNFLVRMRLAALPLLKDMWEASWLLSAPLSVSKSVVQTVLELSSGENEEFKGEVSVGGDTGATASVPRPTGPDENRVRQLVDMGFPRSSVERALIRTHNNVNAATELLLSQPYPLPPDPESDPSETGQEPPREENSLNDTDIIPQPAESPAATPPDDAASIQADMPQGKTHEDWKTELDAARMPLKDGIGKQALRLVDEHPSLIFDVSSAFIRHSDSHQDRYISYLVEDIASFSPYAFDVQEQPLATRCRLLALVLSESPSSLADNVQNALMDNLLALLLSNPMAIGPEHPTTPKWLAAHLLVTEMLLSVGEQPRTISLPKEGEPIVPQEILVGHSFTDAYAIIFDFCMRLLSVSSLPNDELLSVLRLLVLLTRRHELATQFVKQDGILRLFQHLRKSSAVGSHSYIAVILRHIIEDKSTLRHIMQQEIKRLFSQPRTRAIDAGTYLRHCTAMALRDPQTFIDVSQSTCELDQPYSSSYVISLKKNNTAQQESRDSSLTEQSAGVQMQVDMASPGTDTNSFTSTEFLETIVHFLISELMKHSKGASDQSVDSVPLDTSGPRDVDAPRTETGPHIPSNVEGTDTITSSTTDNQDQHIYFCFLMQCLTELLFSYDSCKVAFLSFSSKKRSQTPAKESGSKHRTAALNFLLFDLISFGAITTEPTGEGRRRVMLCNWAMSVIVALCVDSSSPNELKDISSDLVSVRKFVLEAISRAIKDASPTESVESRYGRLLALSDLCHRLLTVRFNTSSRKTPDENPTHIAKVMLEKNFVATLTNALTEVDLNYPNIRTLVAAILKPLEHLSKVAIKMSRASDRNKDSDEGKAESVVSVGSEEEEEEEDVEDSGREETPDLYRNSSLGMYGGEMDEVNFDPEDEMDEDGDDEDEDAEMDFGEETGSEDTSGTDEDEDEGELDEDREEGTWTEEDEDLIENEEDNDDDEGDDDDDDDDGGDDGEEEMMWQDINGETDVADDGEDQDDEDDGRDVIPIIHLEQNIIHEASDEEDYRDELGILDFTESAPHPTNVVLGFDEAMTGQPEPILRGGVPFYVPRRHRGNGNDDFQVFGQVRNPPVAPPEATTHPLLLDISVPTRSSAGQSRNSRRPRAAVAGSTHNELLQSLEGLVGGGAAQLLQHIMTRGRGGGASETIHLDIQQGTVVNLERGHVQRRPQGVISTTLRVERSPRSTRSEGHSFDPLLTLQRWAEEGRILHGKFLQDRATRLNNHFILALLPAAVKKANEAKIKEEQELAERQAQAQAEEATKEKAEETETPGQENDTVDSQMTTDDVTVEDTPSVLVTAPPAAIDADSEMADASDPVSNSENVIPSSIPETSAESSDQGGSSNVERITVMIHGSPVDITDTGIDPTFLEALPDDMREEVLNQHVRDQRAARVERPPDSQISPEFLDALPPDIRAEIIQQERMEQSRRRNTEVPPGGQAPGVPVEMDPASFIASLEPALRQNVLLESDDGFIQTLPSHIIAEAGAYRDGPTRIRHIPVRPVQTEPAPPRIHPPQRDAILLLDKGGITMLARLLFFPQVLKKNLLFKVLVNLCENAKTRTELFNLLLNILQDGTGDVAAVDKSFSQMSFRNSKTAAQQTPKSSGKQKANSDYFNSLATSNLPNEAVPDLVAQRCLEALTYIVTSNEMSSLFFLSEHEVPVGLRRAPSKKGKGKEKQVPQSYYPIVLLLSLLDRQSLLKTPSIMESIVGLLATVTRPLINLKRDKQKDSAISDTPPASAPVPQTSPPQESDQSSTAPSQEPTATGTSGSAPQTVPESKDQPPSEAPDHVILSNPPQIPHSVLRLIVNILTIGECSGRTFQQSLALIQHLSYIPDARDIIAQELKTKAQELGQSLYSDLEGLATVLSESQSDVLASSVASKFSPASSDQAKLLRVLKTIDYMYSPKSSTADEAEKLGDAEKVQGIYESFRFTPLWRRLGDCLAIIEQKPDTEHIATVLLPLIEALMVVCRYVGANSTSAPSARALRASASPRSPTTPKESMEDLFVSFTDAHRKVLNLMVRNNPSLMSGSFSLLVNNPRVLDFDNKRNYFTQQLHKRPHSREGHGTLQLNVRRARVFEDSFQHLQRRTGDQIKYGKLSVRFYDEEGVDAGGVTREWFQILARQMFDPNNALFQPCAADRQTYQPNKNSWVNPEHLAFFKFVGRVIGKAIYDGRLLDAYFARSLYRQLLGKPVDYRDVEWVDPEYYNSLCWILENDPTILDLTFSVEADEFGVNRIVPLKPGGETLSVTQENKREFVQLSASYRLYSSIKDQIESLLAGFSEIVPKELVTIFNEKELELLISGTPDIDVDEWRAATEYNGYTSSDPVIVWWWRALKSFNRDERAKVLSFATGTSRVPLSGFVDLQGVQGVQRFSIHRAYGESDRLPQAHTCFNQIDLPQYSSYEMLRQQLLLAINEGGEGFGFA